MRGIGWWHISVGAMAFGSAGVAIAGFMLFTCLVGLTVAALAFYTLRWVWRAAFPKKIVQQECSPELLARASKMWPDHKVR
jgi:hypothetical protein